MNCSQRARFSALDEAVGATYTATSPPIWSAQSASLPKSCCRECGAPFTRTPMNHSPDRRILSPERKADAIHPFPRLAPGLPLLEPPQSNPGVVLLPGSILESPYSVVVALEQMCLKRAQPASVGVELEAAAAHEGTEAAASFGLGLPQSLSVAAKSTLLTSGANNKMRSMQVHLSDLTGRGMRGAIYAHCGERNRGSSNFIGPSPETNIFSCVS
jgi:hypothetical protein